MPDTTLLGLALDSGAFALSAYAARGLQMTLAPIDGAGNIQRDINANLIDLSATQFRKLKAHISCTDQESPGFAEMSSAADAIWPGSIFVVTCLPQLGSADPITLRMMVMAPGWQITRDEWKADTGWTMDLEQV